MAETVTQEGEFKVKPRKLQDLTHQHPTSLHEYEEVKSLFSLRFSRLRLP